MVRDDVDDDAPPKGVRVGEQPVEGGEVPERVHVAVVGDVVAVVALRARPDEARSVDRRPRQATSAKNASVVSENTAAVAPRPADRSALTGSRKAPKE